MLTRVLECFSTNYPLKWEKYNKKRTYYSLAAWRSTGYVVAETKLSKSYKLYTASVYSTEYMYERKEQGRG
jgi:hypothetical protein